MEHLVQLAAQLAWPSAAVILLLILINSLDRIANAFRSAPVIRRIKLYNVEIELARENLDQLKYETDRSFDELIKKTDVEIKRFARTLNTHGYAANFSRALFRELPSSSKSGAHDPRLTVYISDPIFEDQLYQVSPYCHPNTGRFYLINGKGPGRRFSIRYGLIGKVARTELSEVIGDAFQSEAEPRDKLISHWSMLPEQAEAAAERPSCLALAIKDAGSGSLLGVVYADATSPHYFCEDCDRTSLIERLENSNEFLLLRDNLADLAKLTAQIEIKFDLVNMGHRK